MSTQPGFDNSYKARGLPTYLVLDTSTSMKGFEKLLNDTLLHIYDTLFTRPEISEFIHLSVISFNTAAHVVTPMTDIEQLQNLPTVTCSGATNFLPMAQLVRDQIDHDVETLSASSVAVLRPVVFLLTDGAPTDRPVGTWMNGVDLLQDPGWKRHPHIVTYGFGSASEQVLSKLATVAAYLAEGDMASTGEALSAALASLLNSLVASAKVRQLQVPQEISEFRTLPLDLMD
ncbi:hypothetical protein [Streptomyces sp. NPDC008150]|uniref:vWA domain-containing protein n=1 Tax=Streptomyces sp. NPDC008150 TaxID=3364816 RepID=UPI0036F0DA05